MKKAIMTKGWIVRWWKKMKNGEWKKQNEKIVFDDAQKIFDPPKKRKGGVYRADNTAFIVAYRTQRPNLLS